MTSLEECIDLEDMILSFVKDGGMERATLTGLRLSYLNLLKEGFTNALSDYKEFLTDRYNHYAFKYGRDVIT